MMLAIPAWIAGLLVSQFVFGGISSAIFYLTDVQISASLTPNAGIAATALGLGLPLVASILPIKVRPFLYLILENFTILITKHRMP